MVNKSAGAKANESGEEFENRVAKNIPPILNSPVYKYADWMRRTGLSPSAPKFLKKSPEINKLDLCVLRQAPYTGIRKSKRTVRDFITSNKLGEKTQIELKNQNVAGSCDEKADAAIINMWSSPDCIRGIVVLSGIYFMEHPEDIKDLKEAAIELAHTTPGKTLLVFIEEEFYDYLENNKEII